MTTEPSYAGLKWAHYFKVMLLVPLDQGTQGNKGRKGISLPSDISKSKNAGKQGTKRHKSNSGLFLDWFHNLCTLICRLYRDLFPNSPCVPLAIITIMIVLFKILTLFHLKAIRSSWLTLNEISIVSIAMSV